MPEPIQKPTKGATVKKNFRLHQKRLTRAKAILGARTETEAVERALDLVLLQDELVAGVRAMRGANLIDVFGDDE